jgi:hypothetical protein
MRQFDDPVFTCVITSGGATTNNFPTVGGTKGDGSLGFGPGVCPAKVVRIIVKAPNYTNNIPTTVTLVDPVYGTLWTGTAATCGTTVAASGLDIDIFPNMYFTATPSGDIGAGTKTIQVKVHTER